MREWVLHYKDAIRISLLALFRWTLLAVCTGVLCGGIGRPRGRSAANGRQHRLEHRPGAALQQS